MSPIAPKLNNDIHSASTSNRCCDESNDNNTKSLKHDIIKISNLPIEIIQKIAFQLSPEDYKNFQLVSKGFSEKLENIKKMKDMLVENKHKGELRNNRQKMLCNHLLKYVCDEDLYTLSTVFIVECQKNNKKLVEIGFNYKFHTASNIERHFNETAYMMFIGLNENYFSFNIKFAGTKNMITKYSIEKEKITPDNLKDIFSTANEVFQGGNTYNKCLLASTVTALKNYAYQQSIENKNQIEAIAHSYSDLFSVGMIIHARYPCMDSEQPPMVL